MMGWRPKPQSRRLFNILHRLSFAVLIATAVSAEAAPGPTFASAVEDVRQYRRTHEKAILAEFADLLALPNVATIVEDVEKNAAFIRTALERRGFKTRLLTAAPGTPPALFGELPVRGARRTIVLYAHYDGQPATQTGWRSPPFAPVVRAGSDSLTAVDVDWRTASALDPDWRVYARSASDDKAPIQALLTTLDALRAKGRSPDVNIKVFYEGEEEMGSSHLADILRQHASLLDGDVFIMSDGPRHPSGAMQIFFGVRGSTDLELTVYGPARPLHSGHYGNWAPNPAVMLSHLLASLRDEDGRILVPGFYNDVTPLSAAERQVLEKLPDVETGLKAELALGRTEGRERLADALARPALNVRGIVVGDVGDRASNTIFPDARASIDFRLVPGQRPERVKNLVEEHLRSQGWTVVADEPDADLRRLNPKVVRAQWRLGYEAYRADLNSPEARRIVTAIASALDHKPILLPTLGGSLPLSTFAASLDMPIIGVPIANHDNNQHGANENLRLRNLWDAIDIYASLLTSAGTRR